MNEKWYGDGTEIDTDEGKLYLDSVLDMGSRRVIGFAIGEHHDAQLAYDALVMAVAVRGGKDAIANVIMHTDQGSEFTSTTFRAACERLGIRQSMGTRRVGAGQRRDRELALNPGVRAALARALHHQGAGPGADRRLDRRVQPRPEALGLPDAQPDTAGDRDAPTGPRARHDACSRQPNDGAVLTGVKAKPYGWPTASLDPDSNT